MAHYRVHHKTIYDYDSDVATSHLSAHLEPLSAWGQTVHSFRLAIDPDPRDLVRRMDYFGNFAHFFTISEPHRHLEVDALSFVSVHPRSQIMPELTPSCAEVRRQMLGASNELLQAAEFTLASPRVPIIDEAHAFAGDVILPERPVLSAAIALCAKIHASFKFKPGVTDSSSPITDLLRHKQGVCQDFAHFAIACLRAHGIPAAYMSGYIRTNPPPGRPRLVGVDASHAWISIFIPQIGWVDLDPTNNCLVQDDHITVARGRDYGDVSLIRGSILGGGAQTIRVAVTVEPLASF
ncbi:MAG TPA: transglutaminase family protein [Opitutales bacterium]|nr:transglutaminase family protein [Opitutales bacterium]